jgi:uncharacterized protein YuzE
MESNYEYNSEEDILYIYNTNEPKQIKGSIICNNIVIDISTSGEIVGIQIENVSQFTGSSPDILSKISNARINISKDSRSIIIGWIIQGEGINSNNTFMFPRNKVALSC